MAIPVLMPEQGSSVESSVLTEWQVKPGDAVVKGQVIAQLETDKATFELEAPEDGTVLGLFCDAGDEVPVLAPVAALGSPGEEFEHLRQPAPSADAAAEEGGDSQHSPSTNHQAAAVPTADKPISPNRAGGTSSPRARRAAADLNLSLPNEPGSGPGGRVVERDVAALAVQPPARPETPEREAREIPLKGIRKRIAERMRESLGTTAQITLHRSFDATAVLAYRTHVKAIGPHFGLPNVTINDLIIYAAARTLYRHPGLNAHFTGDRIIEHGTVNIGIAVDTERGLMVPVVAHAETMGLAELSAAVRERSESCNNGTIEPDRLSGGTFTISTLGSLGIESFTPVLNPPQVAILGVGGICLRPVRREHGIDHVDTIALSLTVDHQVVDGAPAARFLRDLCEALERIDSLLSDTTGARQ